MPHKLLLADDSVTIQRVIELTFAEEDIQVIAVSDGKQAIQRVQQDPPDIILADVGMPERDGYEVAMFVKQTPELQHIPVLLLTGAFEPIDEARARGGVRRRARQTLRTAACDQQGQGSDPRATFSSPHPAPQPPLAAWESPATPASARTSAPGAAPAGSIEDYFDRLDAAFSSLDTSAILGGSGARRRGGTREDCTGGCPQVCIWRPWRSACGLGPRPGEGCLGGEDHHAVARPWLDAGAPRRSASCAARTTVSCPCRDRRASAGSGAGR